MDKIHDISFRFCQSCWCCRWIETDGIVFRCSNSTKSFIYLCKQSRWHMLLLTHNSTEIEKHEIFKKEPFIWWKHIRGKGGGKRPTELSRNRRGIKNVQDFRAPKRWFFIWKISHGWRRRAHHRRTEFIHSNLQNSANNRNQVKLCWICIGLFGNLET